MEPPVLFRTNYHSAICSHGVTENSLYFSFSPCKSTNLTTWRHRKQSLLLLFTMQSYKSYYMASPKTVFTSPFHHAKLQILLHGVTVNSLYFSFSPCKATNLTTWCHRKQSLLLLFTMQIYKSYCVTVNSLYLSFSPCKVTNLTAWCYRKQSLLILFTVQSYKSYCIGVTANSLNLSISQCKSRNLTTWCHRKQSLLILSIMRSYKSQVLDRGVPLFIILLSVYSSVWSQRN